MFDQSTLPYLLQRDTIASLSGSGMHIGDRRCYPFAKQSVRCDSVEEAAKAIRDMVTQGGGPLQVGLTAMRMLARQIAIGMQPCRYETFETSCTLLSQARPTNTTLSRTLKRFLSQLCSVYPDKVLDAKTIVEHTDRIIDVFERQFDQDYDAMSNYGSLLIQDGDRILTTCFAEHSFFLSLVKAKNAGKRIAVAVCETRPYLQGARLTAPSLVESGIVCELITDSACAHAMSVGKVNRYMTAADVVAMDGSLANKTGTLQNALCAKHFACEYHAFAMSPDSSILKATCIKNEYRDGKEVCEVRGVATTSANVKGWYPAFDIVPAELVCAIITPKGVLKPSDIARYYALHTDSPHQSGDKS